MDDSVEQKVIDGWKRWHRDLRTVLGLKVSERTVTLEAVRRLVAVREWAKREYELRQSYSGDPDRGGTAMLAKLLDKFDDG